MAWFMVFWMVGLIALCAVGIKRGQGRVWDVR